MFYITKLFKISRVPSFSRFPIMCAENCVENRKVCAEYEPLVDFLTINEI